MIPSASRLPVGGFSADSDSAGEKLARSDCATFRAMSAWMLKMFCAVTSRSYDSAQTWRSLGASTSCTVTCTSLPARCTWPWSSACTPSSVPICRTGFTLWRYSRTEDREVTWSEARRVSTVRISLWIPSANPRLVLSPPTFSKGSTATDLAPGMALVPRNTRYPPNPAAARTTVAITTLTQAGIGRRTGGAEAAAA